MYPSLLDTESEKLERLLRHPRDLDPRYCEIVKLKLAGLGMKEICARLHLKSSRAYQMVSDCEQVCRKFFGLGTGKRKK